MQSLFLETLPADDAANFPSVARKNVADITTTKDKKFGFKPAEKSGIFAYFSMVLSRNGRLSNHYQIKCKVLSF